jgi:hypothetical protein
VLSFDALQQALAFQNPFYNPLAHWDYLANFAEPTINLKQTMINECRGRTVSNYLGPVLFQTPDDESLPRKEWLRSVICGSELSFVVSLLKSDWSKSSSPTRVLSDPWTTDRFCDMLWNDGSNLKASPLNLSPNQYYWDYSLMANSRCPKSYRHWSSQPQVASLRWRPCCGLNSNSLESSWKCSTCGFSTILDRSRTSCLIAGRFSPGLSVPDAKETLLYAELVQATKADSLLSSNPSALGPYYDTPTSATLEFLEQHLQTAMYDELLDHRYRASVLPEEQTSKPSTAELCAKDRFDNTTLHHAAAAQNLKGILVLLDMGTDSTALNTYGQTFLHILDARCEWIEDYIAILRRLMQQPEPFPFMHRDHFGFTIAHRFMLWIQDTQLITSEQMSEVDSLLGCQYIGNNQVDVVDVELDFPARFESLDVKDWASGDADLPIEIDKHGDTCLISILKNWKRPMPVAVLADLIEKLTVNCEPKANVNAYDKDGTTALAIAASKGLYSAVVLLLELGANPNAVDYDRTSVLERAQTYRNSAKKSDDHRLYTAILRCEKELVEHGSVREVNAYTELSVGPSRNGTEPLSTDEKKFQVMSLKVSEQNSSSFTSLKHSRYDPPISMADCMGHSEAKRRRVMGDSLMVKRGYFSSIH